MGPTGSAALCCFAVNGLCKSPRRKADRSQRSPLAFRASPWAHHRLSRHGRLQKVYWLDNHENSSWLRGVLFSVLRFLYISPAYPVSTHETVCWKNVNAIIEDNLFLGKSVTCPSLSVGVLLHNPSASFVSLIAWSPPGLLELYLEGGSPTWCLSARATSQLAFLLTESRSRGFRLRVFTARIFSFTSPPRAGSFTRPRLNEARFWPIVTGGLFRNAAVAAAYVNASAALVAFLYSE